MPRPPVVQYRLEFCEQVRKLAMVPVSEKRMAELIGIGHALFLKWLEIYPELNAALESGRSLADADVVEALYRRAIGFSHPHTKLFVNRGTRADPCFEIVEHTMIEHYPPDTGACEFWLTNRQPEHWRKTQTIENTGPDGMPLLPPMIQINYVDAE